MDSNPNSDHVVQVDDCVYTELIPEPVLEKWSRVNRAIERLGFCLSTEVPRLSAEIIGRYVV